MFPVFHSIYCHINTFALCLVVLEGFVPFPSFTSFYFHDIRKREAFATFGASFNIPRLCPMLTILSKKSEEMCAWLIIFLGNTVYEICLFPFKWHQVCGVLWNTSQSCAKLSHNYFKNGLIKFLGESV